MAAVLVVVGATLVVSKASVDESVWTGVVAALVVVALVVGFVAVLANCRVVRGKVSVSVVRVVIAAVKACVVVFVASTLAVVVWSGTASHPASASTPTSALASIPVIRLNEIKEAVALGHVNARLLPINLASYLMLSSPFAFRCRMIRKN